MNQYLLALIGLLTIFVVGVIMYGVLLKGMIGENKVPLTVGRFIVAGVGMYVIALAFIVIFKDLTFANGATGVMKGLELGLLIGIPFTLLPFYADGPYFKTRDSVLWSVIANWVVALAVLGVVVGALA